MRAVLVALLLGGAAAAEPVSTSGSTVVQAGSGAGPTRLERGPRDALVTIDFFCLTTSPACGRAERSLRSLASRYPDDVRVIYRLVDGVHAPGRRLADAAHEAARHGRHLEFLEALFAEPSASLQTLAQRAGVDSAAITSAVETRKYDAAIESDQRLRELLAGDVLPSAFLNGRGHLPFLEPLLLDRAFADARARAQSDVADGLPRRRLHIDGVEAAIAERARALRESASGSRQPAPGGVWTAHDDRGMPARGDEPTSRESVTIVYFADLDAPLGRRQLQTLSELAQRFPGQLRLLVRLVPGRNGQRVAQAAACARTQGRFWPFVDRLVSSHLPTTAVPVRGGLDPLLLAAQAAGISPDGLKADLDAGRCQAGVAADGWAAQRAGVAVAPALLVGGWRLVGYRSLADLTLLVTDELRPGWLARAAPSGD
jgi:protein-disulfide isomerase